MSCEWVCQHIDAYELGLLDEADRERLEAHVAECAACRKLLDEVRAADEAVGEALAWAEPGPAFAERVLAGSRRPARPWRRVVAAAVAAVACLAVLHGIHRPGGEVAGPEEVVQTGPEALQVGLVAGHVVDVLGEPVDELDPGCDYLACTDAAIEGDRGLFLVPSGTAFAAAPDAAVAMSMHSGTVLGQVRRCEKLVKVELVPCLGAPVVRTTGCQFYSTGVPGDAAGAGEVGVHVFAGTLVLEVRGRRLALAQGDSAIVAGGRSAGSTREVESRVKRLRQDAGPKLLVERRRLQWRPERYARLVAEHPGLAELDAAEAELERLDGLRDAAIDELGRMVTVASAAR